VSGGRLRETSAVGRGGMGNGQEFEAEEITDRDVTPTYRNVLDHFEYVKLDDGAWWNDDEDE
jgi:hypothetical protein